MSVFWVVYFKTFSPREQESFTKFSGKLTFLIPWHARVPLGVTLRNISVDLIFILPTYPYQTGAQSFVLCLKYKFMLIKNGFLIYIILIHNLLIIQSPNGHIFVDSLSIRHRNSTSEVSRYFIGYARHYFDAEIKSIVVVRL